MKILTSGLLLGAACRLSEAGVLGFRQASAQSCPKMSNWGYVTITVSTTATVTVTPPTVTILQEDPNAVTSSMAQIDTLQISQEIIEAPASAPWTRGETFIDPVLVSGYEATEISNVPGESIFYMSKTQTNTDAIPTKSIVAGTLTVTVSPLPGTTTHRQDAQANTTSIAPDAFPVPSSGWNSSSSDAFSFSAPATAVNASTPAGADSGSYGSFAPLTSATDVQPTLTQSDWTSTVTEITTVYADVPANGVYGDTTVYTSGLDVPISSDLQKRQTCVWITAVIGGQEVGWCNNWAGSSTLTFTSWETTVYPSFIPGIGSIPPHQTTSTSSLLPALTSSSPPPPSTSSPAPAPTTTQCGGTGPFQIGFDDLIPNTSDDNFTMAPPIQNPYDYFDWSNGWGYVPPPNEPFPPQSGDRLAVWDPAVNNDTVLGSKNAADLPDGGIGALKNSSNHYWFTAYSAYVGCDNQDPSQVCDFVATAYQWDDYSQSNQVVATQHFHIPACPDFIQCELTQINFNYLFYKLSMVQFYAGLAGKFSKFYVDSIDMNWYNNTCEAGLARISHQD